MSLSVSRANPPAAASGSLPAALVPESAHSETQTEASEMLAASIERVACPCQLWSWKEGMYEIPMIAPSGDWSLATV